MTSLLVEEGHTKIHDGLRKTIGAEGFAFAHACLKGHHHYKYEMEHFLRLHYNQNGSLKSKSAHCMSVSFNVKGVKVIGSGTILRPVVIFVVHVWRRYRARVKVRFICTSVVNPILIF